MSDILVSIIEGIAGAVASAAEKRRVTPPPFRQWVPQDAVQQAIVPPLAVRTPAPARKTDAPAEAAQPVTTDPRVGLRRLFASPADVARAVVASEVLGPPIALRSQNPWDGPRV
jgi:hypothetical protein